MSIKDELKEKRKQTLLNEEGCKRDLEAEARKMINEFLIPKFREISDEKPLEVTPSITFNCSTNGFYYESTIDDWNHINKSPYKPDIVAKAIELVHEFDITGRINSDFCCNEYKFQLNLS